MGIPASDIAPVIMGTIFMVAVAGTIVLRGPWAARSRGRSS